MIVKGVHINATMLETALNQVLTKAATKTQPLGSNIGFTLKDFQQQLEDLGVTSAVAYVAGKRYLQKQRVAGCLDFDPLSKTWCPVQTLAKQPQNTGHQLAQQTTLLPANQQQPNLWQTQPTIPAPVWIETAHMLFSSMFVRLVALSAVLALVTINASFAWELGEGDVLAIAFVVGLAASDLMRPLLIAMGIMNLAKFRFGRGSMAIFVASLLIPLSLLSSTSVLSAKLFQGLEENQRVETKLETKQRLQSEYDRLINRWKNALKAWEDECNRGGCGVIAKGIEAEAYELEKNAQSVLSKVIELDSQTTEPSGFVARNVKAFQSMGLYDDQRSFYIPLGIALTMEISAVFGAGILLSGYRRRKAK